MQNHSRSRGFDQQSKSLPSITLSSERQRRRCQVLLSHLKNSNHHEHHMNSLLLLESNATAASDASTRRLATSSSSLSTNPEQQVDNNESSEEESLNLVPLALISQLTSITTRSLDVYRNALYRYLYHYHTANNKSVFEEEADDENNQGADGNDPLLNHDLDTRFDLQSWTYSLSRVSHNLSFLLLSSHNRANNTIGIKNSSYISTSILALCNFALSVLLNRRINEKWHEYFNPNMSRSTESALSNMGQLQFVLLNCIAHVSSGILERNASVIVENFTSVQKRKLMTAYYFVLTTGAKIWASPIQSLIIEQYGLSTTFFITGLFCLACMPLFSMLEIEEIRGENKKRQKSNGEASSSRSQKLDHSDASMTDQKRQEVLKQRIQSTFKTVSYLCLLFSSYMGKDILQSQSHATLQVCGRMGHKRASSIGALISLANIVINRLLNASDQFVAHSTLQQSAAQHSFSILLLVQGASLAAAIMSKNSRMFAASFSTFSVSLSLLHQHLVKSGLKSGGSIVTSDNTSMHPQITRFQIYILPILSAMIPSLFSLIRNKWFSDAKMSPLRMNLIFLFVAQMLSSMIFKLL